MFVANGKALYFVPDGTGKYEFCSKDSLLQKWCETTKNKRVKANALKFVVNGAKDYLKGKTQLRDTSNSVTANWKDNPVGTNALYPIENLDKRAVFSTNCEPGTDGAAKIKVALISENDMPTTNVAQVIMGYYGPTGKAGIYTAIFGDEGMPFPENIAKRSPDNKEFIAQCQTYWGNHVMLITPKELEANIAKLKAQGMSTKTPELALKSFQNSGEIHRLLSILLRKFHQMPSDYRCQQAEQSDRNNTNNFLQLY